MFYPGDYETKKSEEMVLHYNDDKEDFRPHNLRLGTLHDNGKDAHDNGKYNGKKSARMKCVSYINGKFEKEHKSQRDAAAYIKSKGCSIANLISIQGSINNALSAMVKSSHAMNVRGNSLMIESICKTLGSNCPDVTFNLMNF
jgi:hypothetical protein